ncbi:MAG: helix-turn-helix domain-containing protein [Magnetospirillum sp. WYHS-4]
MGTRIRERRVGLRISQTKLGEAIGVTFQQIQKYENGANRIGSSNLFKVARALGVEVSFFFEGIDDYLKDSKAPRGPGLEDVPQEVLEGDPLASSEGIQLVYNYFRIASPEVQKRLFDLVRILHAKGKD